MIMMRWWNFSLVHSLSSIYWLVWWCWGTWWDRAFSVTFFALRARCLIYWISKNELYCRWFIKLKLPIELRIFDRQEQDKRRGASAVEMDTACMSSAHFDDNLSLSPFYSQKRIKRKKTAKKKSKKFFSLINRMDFSNLNRVFSRLMLAVDHLPRI